MADVTTKLAGQSFGNRLFYGTIRFIVIVICRVYLRLRIIDAHKIPKTGTFILAPSHRSTLDIPVAAATTRRRLMYMGKDSMWKIKPIGAFLTALGSFPVTRGSADLEALKRCIAVLDRGDPLVLFPEGTRHRGRIIEPLFDGAAFIAYKTGVPIIPVGIAGSEEIWPPGTKLPRPRKCVAVVGDAIYPKNLNGARASRELMSEFTLELQTSLQSVFDQAFQLLD
ncbi:MAG: lysophospholipid acyltransferase family protein [bacterium]|jgi:1-acyl-sn-glycerol-3-phosphate acyltransferase